MLRRLFFLNPLPLICVYWLALAYMQFPFWEYIGPVILLATFLPTERVRLMSGLNLAFALITGSILSVSSPTTGDYNYTWPPSWVAGLEGQLWIANPAIFISFAALYFVLFQTFSRLKWIRHPVLVNLAITTAMTMVIFYLEAGTLGRGIVIGTLFAFTRAFWGMCYQLSETDFVARVPFGVHLGTLNSPWQSGWASNVIVRGYSDYCNFAVHDQEKFRQTQLSGLRLILFAVVLQFIANLFFDYFFGLAKPSQFSIAMGLDFSTYGYLGKALPLPYAWLFVLCTILHFLLSLTAYTHTAVSIARMCGFEVWRNVYRPLEATSFNSFLSRIYYYYISVISRFFFYPSWRALRWIHNRNLRTGGTLFLSIFIGGMVTSLLRYLPLQIDVWNDLWIILESRLAYFAMLGCLCCLSALTPKWPSRFERGGLMWMRGLWYCFLYALCYSTQLRTPEYDGLTGLYNLAYLFGF